MYLFLGFLFDYTFVFCIDRIKTVLKDNKTWQLRRYLTDMKDFYRADSRQSGRVRAVPHLGNGVKSKKVSYSEHVYGWALRIYITRMIHLGRYFKIVQQKSLNKTLMEWNNSYHDINQVKNIINLIYMTIWWK